MSNHTPTPVPSEVAEATAGEREGTCPSLCVERSHPGREHDEATDGCRCWELCAMGPTCPGANAGLERGCWRTAPAEPDAVPSEVAEATAGEREVETWAGHGLRCMEIPCVACQIEMVLDDHRAMVSGDDDGWHVICSCGHDELGMGVNAHLATHLAALLDRVRREEGAKVLREAADALVWVRPERSPCDNPEWCCGSAGSCDAMHPTTKVVGEGWLRARAASVGRGEGL